MKIVKTERYGCFVVAVALIIQDYFFKSCRQMYYWISWLFMLLFLLLCRSFLIWGKLNRLFLLLLLCFGGHILKNHFPDQCQEDFTQFFSVSFMAAHIKFKFLNHFELIFEIIKDKGSIWFLCMWLSSFANTICWNDCPFPIIYS